MVSNMEIGIYLQRQRKERGLTQKELADKMHVSFQAVSKWETGESLPDTCCLLELSNVLETTTDQILSAGNIVLRNTKHILVESILEGFNAIMSLKQYFGEDSAMFTGAIEGINRKLNIDFERCFKSDHLKENLLAEIIIYYLTHGYQLSKDNIDQHIQSETLKNIIYKYCGDDSQMNELHYIDNPALFEQIRQIRPELKDLETLCELPGEYIRMTEGKNYWCTEIQISDTLCLGVAVDQEKITVVTYEANGINQQVIHEESIQK